MVTDYILLAAFFAGLVSFLSPCVLPLVPPYLSYMAGISFEQMQAEQRPRAVMQRVLLSAVLFVLGFSTVFVLLGATASLLGQLLRSYLEWITLFAGITIIMMGLHFLGVFRIFFLYREWRPRVNKPAGFGGSYIMGLAFACGWTPCIGPVLGVILAKAAGENTAWQGAGLLGIYSLGLGVPFILTALLTRPLTSFMNRIKARLDVIEKLMGILLVLTGIAFLSGGIATASYWLLETFPALGKLG